jgi:DNA-binding NarL/FixJ family response regulator
MGHTILIAHHQTALRRTLRTLLGFLPCVDAVHEVPDRAQVVAHVAALRPDVVVLILDGPPSLALVRQVRAAGFGGRIVALATSDAPALSVAAAAGVDVVQDTAGVTDGWLSALHRNVCGGAHDTPVDGVKRRGRRDE